MFCRYISNGESWGLGGTQVHNPLRDGCYSSHIGTGTGRYASPGECLGLWGWGFCVLGSVSSGAHEQSKLSGHRVLLDRPWGYTCSGGFSRCRDHVPGLPYLAREPTLEGPYLKAAVPQPPARLSANRYQIWSPSWQRPSRRLRCRRQVWRRSCRRSRSRREVSRIRWLSTHTHPRA